MTRRLDVRHQPCVSAEGERERRGDILLPLADLPVPRGGSTFWGPSRGTATEIDYLTGEIVLLGRVHGVLTPVNALLQQTCRDLALAGGDLRSMDAATCSPSSPAASALGPTRRRARRRRSGNGPPR